MSSFTLLKKQIKNYIYEQRWEELKQIQEASIKFATETDNNFILAAPTASGKTEAAFLPALNFSSNLENSLKIVYISPLVALINDQFKRISKLCNYMDITITSWHGESSKTNKKKLLKNPKGILLITPESLEAMLTLNPNNAKLLFEKVEWIITDEIHSFLDNNRGIQLKSILERLNEYIIKEPRYIGMSATLNKEDYSIAKDFFKNNKKTNILLDNNKNKLLTTERYYNCNDKGYSNDAINEIFKYCQKEKMLIFPNSRGMVELLSVQLNKKVKEHLVNCKIFSHHSAISKNLRLEAENFAKENKGLFSICCTSTLELGIDIGAVDSIVQYNAPHSTASLSQRLGRSGRKSKQSILHFIATNKWDLLQGLAAISLYKKGSIDNVSNIKYPYDVLAHQLLAYLLEKSGVRKKDIINFNKSFSCWESICDDDFKAILNHLHEENYIEYIGDEVIAGTNVEKLMYKGSFFAHFSTEENFNVYDKNKKLGELQYNIFLKEDDNIFLAAKIWKIEKINLKTKKIFVSRAYDGKAPIFLGEGVNVTNEIRAEMENILIENECDSFDNNINSIISEISSNIDFSSNPYLTTVEDNTGIITFKGSKINKTLLFLLNMNKYNFQYSLNDKKSFIYGKNIKETLKELKYNFYCLEDVCLYLELHIEKVDALLNVKYKFLLPDNIKIKYLINNVFDFDGTKKYLEKLDL